MIQATVATLTKKLHERPLFGDQIEQALGTRKPEEVEALLKEKPPLEALRILEKTNRDTAQGYKGRLRGARRQLDSWETQILMVGAAGMFLILIAIILTIFSLNIAALVFDAFAFAAFGADVLLYIKARRLRSEVENYSDWLNEHTRDSRLLSLIANAVGKISVDEAQTVLMNLLFAEEL